MANVFAMLLLAILYRGAPALAVSMPQTGGGAEQVAGGPWTTFVEIQTLIVGIFGFLGVMATILFNAWQSRRQGLEERYHEAVLGSYHRGR